MLLAQYKNFPRLYISGSLKHSVSVNLNKEQSHYLKNVLRKNEGDQIRAFNGKDGEWILELTTLSKKDATALPIQNIKEQSKEIADIHLLFAPIKKSRLDFLIEKSVELGVTHLHPIITERTEVRKLKYDRIQSQIIEASEQCERLDIAKFYKITSLNEAVDNLDKDMQILAAIERAETAPNINNTDISFPITCIIGPEGGFSDKEILFLQSKKNITAISLGHNILRAETAALKFLSCISKD